MSGSGGGTSDADVPDQTGGSGGADADADAGPFCASLNPAPTLCSDFDQQDLPAGWDGLAQWGGCVAVLDSGASVSAPRSLSITSPVLGDSEQCASALEGAFPQPTSTLVIELDVYVEVFDSPEWVHLVVVQLNGAEGFDEIVLRMRTNEASVTEGAILNDGGLLNSGHPVANVPAVGQWSHVRWELSFGGSTAFSNVNVNGTSSGDSIHAKSFVGPVDLQVGVAGVVGPLQSQVLRFDNIVVDVL